MRYVNVVSGLTCTRKSTLLDTIIEDPLFAGLPDIRMDKMGEILYKERQAGKLGSNTTELTSDEKRIRNYATFLCIGNLVRYHETPFIMAEIPLLTQEYHQKPFVDILMGSQLANGGPEEYSSIQLNVVLLHASFDRIVKRMEERKTNLGKSLTDALDIQVYLDAAREFDFPVDYTPLIVDTTDESIEAERNRIHEITSFFLGAISHAELDAINTQRKPKLMEHLEQALSAGQQL